MAPNVPSAVYVIPMDSQKEEFPDWSIEDVQRRFFLCEMPWAPSPGRYQYRTRRMRAEAGTIVLFQFKAHIVASAVLQAIEQYPQPDGPYDGAYWFDPASIRVFKPVGAETVRKVWPKFKQFGNVFQKLEPPSHLPTFEAELSGVSPAGAAPQAHDLDNPPAVRVETTISRIVRDTQLANRVKAVHNFECQICGHSIILADGSRYAEAHHVQPLGEPHNGPDVMENIQCLCPNHHAACDLAAIRLHPSWLRTASGHHVGQQYIEYHNHTVCRAGR